ncbi:MAG: YcaO-like family protein [Shimia sp.]|uniref:YcaO-like family protein n=1 Tax=Shimia sp. TaxID=1954381 RepID=UPI001B2A9C0E|nr:YcaO-like family protein [Shimia sp.]MBO6899057.1 YcaO-like family protein [Shimia sp.]
MFTQLQELERRLEGDLILPRETPAFCAAVLRRLDFVFVGQPSVVPGLVVAGGVLTDGTPVSGAGRRRTGALTRLAGEAAEQLGLRAAVDGLPHDQDVPVLDWQGARTGGLDRDVLPLSSSETAGFSEGLAAHVAFSEAVDHGALELFERDAAAHWWAGATKAVLLSGTDDMVDSRLGVGRTRSTRILDVTCDTGVPAVVAASFDAQGGGFCFGAAARVSLVAAVEAAIRELGAAEFGLALERSRGTDMISNDTGLTAQTLTLAQLETDMVGDCRSLQSQTEMCTSMPKQAWPDVLQENGIGIVDLGCVEGQFRVIKAVSAALQPGQETYVCPRFAAALTGKRRQTQGPLY